MGCGGVGKRGRETAVQTKVILLRVYVCTAVCCSLEPGTSLVLLEAFPPLALTPFAVVFQRFVCCGRFDTGAQAPVLVAGEARMPLVCTTDSKQSKLFFYRSRAALDIFGGAAKLHHRVGQSQAPKFE